ncbi:uncharacterized protein KGF55_003575 [Candida pseudojiufengensis]|uniref:uncharacterized protein n=1 Tax=Candida pseudojiufengensis TaxID=497109 RepID=UPI00222483FE|nr:uncharacterized protein KGF55_003575 [Candida pseudojiufengensis]KAI5962499.1 hypothetical protein KGF55_003575 [Candida pseudojiufengensis]
MIDQMYYSNGYQESKSKFHSYRNVENSGKFITPYLQQNYKMLDVGCGPGSITLDFAKNYLTKGGSVVGIEPIQQLVDTCNELKQNLQVDNAKFQLGSIYKIPFPDNCFDLVYCNQVIVHLDDPIRGLKELLRVVRPGGFICLRDADLQSTIITPINYEILKHYSIVITGNNRSSDIRAGRNLKSKILKAGYDANKIKDISIDPSLIWRKTDKRIWSDINLERIKSSNEIAYPLDFGRTGEIEKQVMKLYPEWVEDDDSLISIPNFQIVYRK